ncbi:Lysine-specific demethylase JMJ32, partial [Linum perenne]
PLLSPPHSPWPNEFPRHHLSDSDSPPCFASGHVEYIPFPMAPQVIPRQQQQNEGGNSAVVYLQQQNDCFYEEYSPLSGDFDSQDLDDKEFRLETGDAL